MVLAKCKSMGGELMLNEAYILQIIKPHLNAKCELSEFEFFVLFSGLNRREQYEVVNIMIAHNIDLVEEKEEETEQIDQADIIRRSTVDTGYEQMLHLFVHFFLILPYVLEKVCIRADFFDKLGSPVTTGDHPYHIF